MDSLTKINSVVVFMLLCSVLVADTAFSATFQVGEHHAIKRIQEAVRLANNHDSIVVESGTYNEGNLLIDKSVYILGIGHPVLDGQKKYEIVSIKANGVVFDGFTLQHSGVATLDDPCAIKVYDTRDVVIQNNRLEDNFFGIYIQYGKHCIVRNNHIVAYGTEEQQIGNGIHCWKSDSLQIIGNYVSGHRDGIYFEFVTHSIIWRNRSFKNIRYGLHFMFSNNDDYIC